MGGMGAWRRRRRRRLTWRTSKMAVVWIWSLVRGPCRTADLATASQRHPGFHKRRLAVFGWAEMDEKGRTTDYHVVDVRARGGGGDVPGKSRRVSWGGNRRFPGSVSSRL
ncbi:hypothetical protein LZ30DRAFT_724840 [Colletotrichum cereale]|nr:hypothetical protein LZ30DRAFT_724840 [Colletotrichum cereale]